MAVRPGTGPISAWSSQAGYAQSGTGPRPSFQPGGGSAASRPPAGRPSDRGDWGERTERIDRVNAAGYPEHRGNGRGQVPGRPAAPTAAATSDSFRAAGGPGAPGRGRIDAGRIDAGRADNGRADSPDWRTPDRREPGRDLDREPSRTTGGWPAAGRGGLPANRPGDRAGADDPLTSTAYSRASASESDGRSYRVAARRSQAQAKLTEETQVFSAPIGYPSEQHRTGPYDTGLTGEYPARQYDTGALGAVRGGQYQTGSTGEYPTGQHRTTGVTGVTGMTGKSAADQYRTGEYRTGEYRTGEYDQYRADAQAPAARHPGYSSSQPGQSGQPNSATGSSQSVHPAQPSRRGQQGPAGPGGSNTPSGANGSGGQPVGNSGRVSLPNAAGAPSGQYPTQPPRHRQQRPQPQPPQSQPPRQPAQPQLPPTGGQGGNGQAGTGPADSAAGRPLPASSGRNPYESAVTGSYPYPGQPYPPRPTTASNRPSGANPALDGRDVRDDRYYRPGPSQADGYNPGNDGYGAPRDGRY
jgi:hypothetical protein